MKVEEAMTVYDEYVKNNQGPGQEGSQQPNGGENKNPSTEEVKDAEA